MNKPSDQFVKGNAPPFSVKTHLCSISGIQFTVQRYVIKIEIEAAKVSRILSPVLCQSHSQKWCIVFESWKKSWCMYSYIKCALDFPSKQANLRLALLHGFGGCAMLA